MIEEVEELQPDPERRPSQPLNFVIFITVKSVLK